MAFDDIPTEDIDPAKMQEYSEAFDTLCQNRWADGQEEYGHFTFLGNDVIRMMIEELADTANYARMQTMKLLALNDALAAEIKGSKTEEAQHLGTNSFKGTNPGWVERA